MKRADEFLIEEYKSFWAWLTVLFKESRIAVGLATTVLGIVAGVVVAAKPWEYLASGLTPAQASAVAQAVPKLTPQEISAITRAVASAKSPSVVWWSGAPLLLLYILGWTVLAHLISCRALAVRYTRAINQLRTYFAEKAPDIRPALLFPHLAGNKPSPPYYSKFGVDHWYSIILTIMNSTVGAFLAWLLLCPRWRDLCRGPTKSLVFWSAFAASCLIMQIVYAYWLESREHRKPRARDGNALTDSDAPVHQAPKKDPR